MGTWWQMVSPPFNEVLPESVGFPAGWGAAVPSALALPDVCSAVTDDHVQIFQFCAHSLHHKISFNDGTVN